MAELTIFWEQLLQLIDEGKVVPVVGPDLLTVPESTGHTLLYPLLADRLAKYLRVSGEDLPDGAELNEVACRYLGKGKPAQHVYAAIKSVAGEIETIPTPEPLLQLAAIQPFQLFVTTTFDPLLPRALNERRFGGNARTQIFAHTPNDPEDLPGELKGLGSSIVYHLMGKLSATPAYAVTQEDLVEFFHSLRSETHRPAQLFHEMSNRNLLLLGTRLSGWLTSFLMRMSKRQRLSSDDKADYVADRVVSSDEELVLFLERFSSATEIYREGTAVQFVNTLFQYWTERRPQASEVEGSKQAPVNDAAAEAVFLSYASDDRAIVEKIKAALEEKGVDVFFDRDQLQAGNDWETKLRRRIHSCSLFVPVISKQTLTSDRRFFRVEWHAALEEAQKTSFSAEDAFLIPVVIDDTDIDHPALPDKFRTIQWTRLPGGKPSSDFVDRVRDLYRKRQLTRTAAL